MFVMKMHADVWPERPEAFDDKVPVRMMCALLVRQREDGGVMGRSRSRGERPC